MSALSEEIKGKIREHFSRYPSKQAVTLPALHMVQEKHGFVSNEAMKEIAELLELSPAQIFDTMSFYGFFRDEKHPLGKKRVWICRSISCSLRGAEDVLREACERLHIAPGETTSDGAMTIEYAECLGACDGAPCMLINDELKERISVEDVLAVGNATLV